MTRAVSRWYKPDIGPRLKPKTRKLFETWSGLAGDDLIAHLHHVVRSLSFPDLLITHSLTYYTSVTRPGNTASILVLENGCSSCPSYQISRNMHKS